MARPDPIRVRPLLRLVVELGRVCARHVSRAQGQGRTLGQMPVLSMWGMFV